MEDAGYQYARAHKKVHDIFTRRISDFQLRLKAGEDITEDLLGLFSRWLYNHIRNDDASYVGDVKSDMQALVDDKEQGGWLSRSLDKFFR